MTRAHASPVITVLCTRADERPPRMEAVEERAEVRYTDSAGLAAAIGGADALFLWDFFSTAVKDVWQHADRLRWIHVAAAGVDTLLFDELVDSDVVVTNAHGVFDRPIAEYVLSAVLDRAKRTHENYDLQRSRTWRHRETETIRGKNALVIGTGGIGREIARLLTAVGMRVRGAGRAARSDDRDFGEVVASDDLVAHVGWADHVVLAVPLTDQTRGLVGEEVLAAMHPSAHLVNIARGPVVDESALIRAVTEGSPAAATLDVFATEPLPAESPLWSTPGVVVTPHMSGDVAGWTDALARQFADNALRWLDGSELVNVVDLARGYVPSPPGSGAETGTERS
ncbi:D-2-hydroxyacid dehydrogenase [Salinifilum ghardaiensis]